LELNPPITVKIPLTFWSQNASWISSTLDAIDEDENISHSSQCFQNEILNPSFWSFSMAMHILSSLIIAKLLAGAIMRISSHWQSFFGIIIEKLMRK